MPADDELNRLFDDDAEVVEAESPIAFPEAPAVDLQAEAARMAGLLAALSEDEAEAFCKRLVDFGLPVDDDGVDLGALSPTS